MARFTKRRLRRIVGIGVVAAASLVVGIVTTMVVLVRSEPAHWKAHQQYLQSHSHEQIAEHAAEVEIRILSLAPGTVRRSERGGLMAVNEQPISKEPVVRQVFFNQDELNAWVAEKFHEWMTYRDYVMPREINDPMISIEDGRLMLSFELRVREFSQVFTAGFDVTFQDDGMALLELRDVMAGRLAIGSDGIDEYLRDYAPDNPRVNQVADWLGKLHRLEFKPSMKIGESHKARVIDYRIVNDGVNVTLELEPRPSYIARREAIASVPTDDQ